MDDERRLTNADRRLLDIIWESEPLESPELCRLALDRLGWKRTTTYTVLKRLCQRGYAKNESAVVSSLISREEVQTAEIESIVEKSFDGSLPAFLAAFSRRKKLSEAEIDELKRLIDESGR